MSSFIPGDQYTSQELNKLYPQNVQLEHVQIFLRHGERTPTGARFQHIGLPSYWPYCNAAHQLTNAVLNSENGRISPTDSQAWTPLTWRRRLETQGVNDTQITAVGAEGKTAGMCIAGELTDRGRETTLALGRRLRKLYIDQLAFMPDSISDASLVNLRTTHMSRALESLLQAFTGLYPASSRDSTFQATIATRRWDDEQLYPNNGSCKRYAMLFKAFSKRAATIWNDSPEMDYINSKIQKHMPEKQRVAVDGHPALVGIMDTNNSRLAHGSGVPLPREFDDEQMRKNIDMIARDEWFRGYVQNREHRMLGSGALVGDILENITKHVEDKDRTGWKFSMNGCHDTTLAGIMSSLGLFSNEPWPPFTSHIAIETFRSKDTQSSSSIQISGTGFLANLFPFLFASATPSIGRTPFQSLSTQQKGNLDGYYVRIRYNDRPFTIPGCKAAGKHLDGDESFCTLAAFKEIADKFVPMDWKAACKMNLDKGILAEEDIEAGY